jgi:hypothetical protein
VAVPEAGSYDEALAVEDGGAAGNFDLPARSDGKDVAVADEDGTVFDGPLCGGEIDFGTDQGQVGVRFQRWICFG